MNGRQLIPCGACGRHVRAAEGACPFCGGALSGASASIELPQGRLSRAALVAFGLTVAASGAAAGCGGSSSEQSNGGTIVQGGATSSGGEGASTGGSVDSDAGAVVTSDDAGATGTPSDASTDADATAVAPIYGAPVARYGAPPPSDV